MRKIYIIATLCLWAALSVYAAPPIDRSQLSIMVVPYTSDPNMNVLKRIENDAGYKEAIATIQNALLNRGYDGMVDFKTHYEVIRQRMRMPTDVSPVKQMESYITEAPVDIIVEAEIFWTDPPGDARNRQARILLRAIDKYNAALYATSASVQSFHREFESLPQAVQHALTKDGANEFNNFLQQLDSSYAKVIKEGRAMFVKFKVAGNSNFFLTDRVDNERLLDKIAQWMGELAFRKQYKLLGESKEYCDYRVKVAVVDGDGNSITPTSFIRYQIDQKLKIIGLDVDYNIAGAWINFTIMKRSKPAIIRD